MFFAIVGNDKHHRPEKGLKGKCPFCEEEVVAKCGQIKTHHWAHLANSNCQYKENKGEWHRQWQEKFDDNWQEILMINQENGEKNIADIKTPSGLVIEFQHSHIEIAEREAREKFYKNMVWVVDATQSKIMQKYFNQKLEGKQDIEGFNIDNFEYDKFKTWHRSQVPVFYDLYGLEDSTEKTELQKYLYCVFPQDYTCYGCRYVLSIERNVFIKLVKDEKLNELLKIKIEKIKEIQQKRREEIKRQEEERKEKERKRQKEYEDYARKVKEEERKQKAITHQNAIPKSTHLEKIFDLIHQQKELVYSFYRNIDILSAKLNIVRDNKLPYTLADYFNPQWQNYKHKYSEIYILCSTKTYLGICNDFKNCNIRKFLCCPENGTTLNEYWKNIKKDTMFFTGKIKHFGKSVEFSGYPILKIADKNKKYISVLCQNYLDGKKQNNYSLVHIIYNENCYIHYQYYATSEILIFLKNVCNNNNIEVRDINIIDEKYKNSSI